MSIRRMPAKHIYRGMIIVVNNSSYRVVEATITQKNKIRIKGYLLGKSKDAVSYSRIFKQYDLVKVRFDDDYT